MQDAEESQPPNRWLATLIIVALAQALGTGGISLVYPFLHLTIQTLRDACFISPELLAGTVIGAPPLVVIYYLAILLIGAQLSPKSKRQIFRFSVGAAAGS